MPGDSKEDAIGPKEIINGRRSTDRLMQEPIFNYEIGQALLATVPLLSVDSSRTIVQANTRADELFGYPIRGLVGQLIDILLPPESRGVHTNHVDNLFKSPHTMVIRPPTEGIKRDGTKIPVQVVLIAHSVLGRELVTALIIPIQGQ
jgi:PAS domain S-box-containing protein